MLKMVMGAKYKGKDRGKFKENHFLEKHLLNVYTYLR